MCVWCMGVDGILHKYYKSTFNLVTDEASLGMTVRCIRDLLKQNKKALEIINLKNEVKMQMTRIYSPVIKNY